MKSKVQEVIGKILFHINQAHASREQMIEDLKLMRFKIKTIDGDFIPFSEISSELLESLWKIGCIDSILQTSFRSLSDDEKEIVVEFLRSMEEKMNSSLFREYERLSPSQKKTTRLLKLVVFRDDLTESILVN